MVNSIGRSIPTYDLYIRRKSEFGFVIHWWEDDAYTIPVTDINGKDFQVIVGERDTPVQVWTTTAVGNTTSFHYTVDESDLDFDLYDGLIIMSPGPAELALADTKIIVQPG